MSETIGQVRLPNTGELLDVVVSGPWKDTGLWRIDFVEAEGEYAGMQWSQVGKNIDTNVIPYSLPTTKYRYALLKSYSENQGYAQLLFDAGLAAETGRIVHVSSYAHLIECRIIGEAE